MKLIQTRQSQLKKDKSGLICSRCLTFLKMVATVRDSDSFNKLFLIKEKKHVQLS
jgi:hypothetical protein